MTVFNYIADSWHWLLVIIALAVGYFLYRKAIGYAIVDMRGNYDQSRKDIGQTPPPFPNGWYIALKRKELSSNKTKLVKIAGENILLTRDSEGKVNALGITCEQMDYHWGIKDDWQGRKVQCPVHRCGFDVETGQLVENDALKDAKNFQNNSKIESKVADEERCPSLIGSGLRSFIVRQVNVFIYVWIHADPSVPPYFSMIDGSQFCKDYRNSGFTFHDIKCHLQDIPQNGADMFHFMYVHRYLIAKYKALEVMWKPKWKRGDDPNIADIFEHPKKNVREFKQRIYQQLIKPLPNKQYYSFASVDNYSLLPLFGKVFFFNITIVQMGPALVNVFLKTEFFEVVFFQYIQPQGPARQHLYHEMFSSSWLPAWVCYIMLYAQGMQVYNDMLVWDAKKFGHRIFLKNNEADSFIQAWREWFSQHYLGCHKQFEKRRCNAQGGVLEAEQQVPASVAGS